MNILDALRYKHDEIMKIARAHGATRVRLFGSAITGNFNDMSDIDVLVTMKPKASLLDIIAIKQDLEDLLGRRVDVVTEESISPYFKDEVLKKAVNL